MLLDILQTFYNKNTQELNYQTSNTQTHNKPTSKQPDSKTHCALGNIIQFK